MYEDMQKLFDEFEAFMTEHMGLKFSEFDKYNRKKLGRYFDQRDSYFALWLTAKNFYLNKAP
ncbi:hypothetical protein P255_02973 [Acinetobacter brisouii CIP 110357]|uniref:Uncharacterized protein n=1 Tax=Acinetobacter brisouii CIP 110357 TaxID=1341683 RepID=V2UG50_9GAMM|nr:hypothetical protein [Acinetobacter brisouii]ENV46194.1 hypothetical protein F954_02829 [Acinetobacter brisouii ANC 4119]ESK47491.1 hypothetical protein P255_02973 [Acinetobacter brisouii CIP 110357]